MNRQKTRTLPKVQAVRPLARLMKAVSKVASREHSGWRRGATHRKIKPLAGKDDGLGHDGRPAHRRKRLARTGTHQHPILFSG
jgi:hypothetical protein